MPTMFTSSNTAVSKIAQSIVSCASRNWFPCWANITTSTLSWNYRFYNIINRGDRCMYYSCYLLLNKCAHRCIQLLLCGLCPKECSRVHPLNVSERLSIVFAVGYVPRGIESLNLRACDSCKTSINGRSNKLISLPNASMSMCTHFPALFGDS